MPRKPRFYLPGVPVHVVQRGHNREAVFFEDDDYYAYLGRLKEGSICYVCNVHAYCLMTNHIHLLLTPRETDSVTRMMQYVGRHYVPYVNYKYGKSGSLWEGRYKASLVDAENYLLSCMRYIELNPVRAQMVKTPAHYRWSSYRHNAQGRADALISLHSVYKRLARDKAKRLEAYKALFRAHQDDKQQMKAIRAAWQTGTPLGDDRFRAQIEATLGRKVGQARRGRPRGAIKRDRKLSGMR